MSPTGTTRWMRRALELAARGRCGASPNPMVGAVVLDRGGQLVGEGYHAECGGPHAEVVALRAAGERARGGTVFVTLEPCAHHGRTPPCVEALLASGVARVVVAQADPSERAGGGAERLRASGVEVEVLTDDLTEAAHRLNRRWLRWADASRPWVTLKAAVSLDGRIATSGGESQWITGSEARRCGLELREEHDAILVGVGTVLADDPNLTRRLGLNPGERWRRVVLDSRLRTPPGARIVTSAPEQTVLMHTAAAPGEHRQRLCEAGVTLVEVPADDHGRVAARAALAWLAANEVAALLVEGGAQVHGTMVDIDAADELFLFAAGLILGGQAPVAVAGRGVDRLSEARRWRFEDVVRRGDDVELHAVVAEEADVHRAG